MGFGFNLFIALIILPLTVALLIIWLLTRRKFFIISLGVIWTIIFAFLIIGSLLNVLLSKVTLEKKIFMATILLIELIFQENKQIGNTRVLDLKSRIMIQSIFTHYRKTI